MSANSPLLQIQQKREEEHLDALLITHLPDIRWATGFSGSNALLLILPERIHFFTDGRYAEQAAQEVRHASIHITSLDPIRHIFDLNLLHGVDRIGFQAEHVSVYQLAQWKERFSVMDWHPLRQLLTRLVAVKTEVEIARIRSAQAVTETVFQELLAWLTDKVNEREVAAEIVYRHLRHGAERMSFDPIVASGPNGALPHARPSDRHLSLGDLIVIDMGCFVDGYASDMTRTIALGEPGDEARRVYEVVLEGQMRALDTARAGIKTNKLDAAARAVIEAAGYGDQFTHSLGHGVGLQIHEWPRISSHTEDELPAGAVVTIEPGVYLPGRFGVRIEDLIVLREAGNDNLTASPKSLLVL